MSRRRLPPLPTGSNWQDWARRMVEYMQDRGEVDAENVPRPILLSHQVGDPLEYRAFTDGIVMYDPLLQAPVYSLDGAWHVFTNVGDLNYQATTNAGNGTVTSDINNTDFSGQEGAVGQCAQVPVGVVVSFYHKGLQYIYGGDRPASYGAGCSDTITDSDLIPVGAGEFTGLLDTPSSYLGSAGKFVKVGAAETQLEFWNVVEEDILDLNRTRWMGNWTSGTTYEKNDIVLDGTWLMVANTQTDDPAAPQHVGDPKNVYQGTSPTSTITAKTLRIGNRYTLLIDAFLVGYRVYTVAGNDYTVYLVDGYGVTRTLQSFTAISTGWQSFVASGHLTQSGVVFEVGVYITEPAPTPVVWTGDWNYTTPHNNAIPPAGTIVHSTKETSSFRISSLDDVAGDRYAELAALQVGDVIEGAGMRWSIQTTTDHTTWFDFSVVPVQQGTPTGVQTFTFETGVSTPITTVIDPDYYLPAIPQVEPYYSIDNGAEVPTDDGYGIDVTYQEAAISPNWDAMANSASSTGSGGSSSFDGLNDTPPNKVDAASKIPVVTPDESALEYLEQGVSVFSETHVYYKDDIISREGILYHCISDGPVSGPFNMDDWSPAGTPTGSGITLRYRWTTVTAGTPPDGTFGITDAMANPTNTLRISNLSDAGVDVTAFWSSIENGDYVTFIEDTGGAESGVWIANGTSVNQGTYHEIPVDWVANVGEPENDRKGFALIVWNPNDRIPAGGNTGEALVKSSPVDYETEWFDLSTTYVLKAGDTMTGPLTATADSAFGAALLANGNGDAGGWSRLDLANPLSGSGIFYVDANGSFVMRNLTAQQPILFQNSAGDTQGRFDDTHDLDFNESIVTREKGDARYPRLSGGAAAVFTGTITVTNAMYIQATNPAYDLRDAAAGNITLSRFRGSQTDPIHLVPYDNVGGPLWGNSLRYSRDNAAWYIGNAWAADKEVATIADIGGGGGPDFDSGWQTFSNNSKVSAAHGLGATPSRISHTWKFKTAVFGYAIGDILVGSGPSTISGTNGHSVGADGTEVWMSSLSDVGYVPNKAGAGAGAGGYPTAADLDVRIMAWA